MEIRIEAVRTDSVKTTSQGFVEIDAVTARTGVQKYKKANGEIRREFRPEAEVFNQNNIDALRTSVVTNDHPPVMVTPLNAKKYMVGFPTGPIEKITEPSSEEKYLKTKIVITDKATIDAINSGKAELSNGYFSAIENSPGIYKGESYDMIQRNIINNHIAVVWKGRGGQNVRLVLDSEAAILMEDSFDYENYRETFDYDSFRKNVDNMASRVTIDSKGERIQTSFIEGLKLKLKNWSSRK